MKTLPQLVTFDGEARSGKGTVVSLIKDYLRDEAGRHVMLIDSGQIFRVLVLVLTEAFVDLDNPERIDAYLSDPANVEAAVVRVKEAYRMPKADRKELLYSPDIGTNSAKVGGRPLSQEFKDRLLKKWLIDAGNEGFDTVLLDGRALEQTGLMLEREGLCDYVLGMFFVCDPVVSAQRTLGYMPRPFEELDDQLKHDVEALMVQIETRNHADRTRIVQPVVPPPGAVRYLVSELPDELPPRDPCPAVIIDRSIELPFETMALPIIRLTERYLAPLPEA